MKKQGFVYMMSNKNRTTLYIGVTNNLERRVLEHKAGIGSAFTKRYNVHDLMYWEKIYGMGKAIAREKQLKRWHKDWKWNLIKEDNDVRNVNLSRQQHVLAGLGHGAISCRNNQHRAVHLCRTGDHIFNIISVTWTINMCIMTNRCFILNMRSRNGQNFCSITSAL